MRLPPPRVLLLALSSIACGHPAHDVPGTSAPAEHADEPSGSAGDNGLPPGYARPAPLASLPGAASADREGGAGTSSNGLANPGPTANPCTRDDECITHKCNPAFHRCAFPCVSDRDCTTGNHCYQSVVAVCLPRSDGSDGGG